jgi:hypothetical protein
MLKEKTGGIAWVVVFVFGEGNLLNATMNGRTTLIGHEGM